MDDTDTRPETRISNDATSEATNSSHMSDDRWLTDTPVLGATLPDDVGTLLGRLLGDDPVETLGDWVDAVRRHTGGGSIDVEELCHSGSETPHWGEIDGHRSYFRCFYDAVILSALVDEPVDVRTESPGGAVIVADAAGTDALHVTPTEAVFSFGVDEAVDAPTGDGPSNADVYSAICPYVRAFPHPDAYHRWADAVPAATVAMPLSGATDVAAALVEPATAEGTAG